MAIHEFMRRWGNVSLVREPNGEMSVWGSEPASSITLDLNWASLQKEPKTARVNLPSFSHEVDLDHGVEINWNVNEDVLKTTTLSGQLIEKLSWNPRTGETLLVWPGNHHASVRGKSPFDDYVRVVILQNQHKCTFRPFWPSWAKGIPGQKDESDAFDLSYSAQEACENALRANGSKGWTFQYNVDNAIFTEMSGHSWW